MRRKKRGSRGVGQKEREGKESERAKREKYWEEKNKAVGRSGGSGVSSADFANLAWQ